MIAACSGPRRRARRAISQSERSLDGWMSARGRGRGRNPRGRGAAPEPTPAADEPGANTDLDEINFTQHPIGIIIGSHDPPGGIRFSIKRELFKSYPPEVYDALPDRIIGVIDQAIKKADGKYKIVWPVDNSNTTEYLATLLAKEFELKLETYENGRAPPKAKGMLAKRAYAGGRANRQPTPVPRRGRTQLRGERFVDSKSRKRSQVLQGRGPHDAR